MSRCSSEPGFPDLVDALVAHLRQSVAADRASSDDGVPLPLQWGVYRVGRPGRGAVRACSSRRRRGCRPRRWRRCATVLVPALAVDRQASRLGRGAGFYDRSLGFRDPAARLVAVVRDDELVDELPAEPHDVAMTHALTRDAAWSRDRECQLARWHLNR